jgi:hypothetical protein
MSPEGMTCGVFLVFVMRDLVSWVGIFAAGCA